MADPFADQRGRYNHTVSATALLFSLHGFAIRLECATIGLEFTDGLYIGSDPDGLLSYNNIKDFKADTDVTTNYVINELNYEDDPILKIKFSREGVIFAEFAGYDRRRAVQRNAMNGHEGNGTWKSLSIASATASVKKELTSGVVTLDVPSLHRRATFSVAGSGVANRSLGVYGMVFFKNINTLNNGLVVNYSSDRLVFYKDAFLARDFTAYFIPFEDGDRGVQNLELNNEREFSPVAWAPIPN